MSLIISGHESGIFLVSTGIPQGSPVSPILFLFYNIELFNICTQPGRALSACGFVDDVNILICNNIIEGNYERLIRIYQKYLYQIRRYSASFAPAKYELIYFIKIIKKFNLDISLKIGSQIIKPKNFIRILDIQIDIKL